MDNIAEKKKAIFESTLELIKEHGFHGTPMSLVAKSAGVAAGTIYHYFESKEQLICELYSYNKSRAVNIVKACIDEESTFKDKFFKIWNSLYIFYTHNTNVLIFFEQYLSSPYNVNKSPNYYKGVLFDFFVGGMQEGHIKESNPELLLSLLLGSITSAAKLNTFGNISLTERDLQQIVQILWDGISSVTKTS